MLLDCIIPHCSFLCCCDRIPAVFVLTGDDKLTLSQIIRLQENPTDAVFDVDGRLWVSTHNPSRLIHHFHSRNGHFEESENKDKDLASQINSTGSILGLKPTLFSHCHMNTLRLTIFTSLFFSLFRTVLIVDSLPELFQLSQLRKIPKKRRQGGDDSGNDEPDSEEEEDDEQDDAAHDDGETSSGREVKKAKTN